MFALADNDVSSSNHSLCSKSALRGEYAEQDALKSAEVKASKVFSSATVVLKKLATRKWIMTYM